MSSKIKQFGKANLTNGNVTVEITNTNITTACIIRPCYDGQVDAETAGFLSGQYVKDTGGGASTIQLHSTNELDCNTVNYTVIE